MLRQSLASALLTFVAIVGACNHAGPDSEADPDAFGQLSIADSIKTLRVLRNLPSCSVENSTCSDACAGGDAASCLSRAYAVEKKASDPKEAISLYRRSCLLGSANACTNYAANIWANPHTDLQLMCARRTFEKACQAKEHFACGMVGRVILEGPASPDEIKEGRRYLEAACDELEGFPCRVLAKNLESGKFGDYDPHLIRTLLKRACAGGDPDGCGEPATAAETFH